MVSTVEVIPVFAIQLRIINSILALHIIGFLGKIIYYNYFLRF